MNGIILIIQTLERNRTESTRNLVSLRSPIRVLDGILKVDRLPRVLEVLIEADPVVHIEATVLVALVNLVDLEEDEAQAEEERSLAI